MNKDNLNPEETARPMKKQNRKHADEEIVAHAISCTQCAEATEQLYRHRFEIGFTAPDRETWLDMIDDLHEWGTL